MASKWKEIFGFILAIVGFIFSIIIYALPMWRVTLVGSRATDSWGLWKVCRRVHTDGLSQCSSYNPSLTPTKALVDTRTLIAIAICLGIVAIALALASGRCASCMKDKVVQAKVALASGITFLIPGVLVLMSVCWLADTEIDLVLKNHTSNITPVTQLGVALYIGCCSAALMLIGGCLVCSNWPPKEHATLSFTSESV